MDDRGPGGYSKGMRILSRAWLVLFAAAVFAAAQESTSFEVYSVGSGDPAAMETVVRSMVGEGSSVVLDPSSARLLVVATAAEHQRIAEALGKMDLPARNVQITVEFRKQSQDTSVGAGLSAEGSLERTEGITHTTIRVAPRIENTSILGRSDVAQTLLVASGREGLLRVGEQVPYIDWLVDYGLTCGLYQQRIAWQEVGSSLVVEPTVIGEGPMIRIRITPQLSGLVDGNPYHTRFAGVSTEVVVQDGQTFQIGGADKDEEFYSRFLIGFNRSGSQEKLGIFLTPRIFGASPPASLPR